MLPEACSIYLPSPGDGLIHIPALIRKKVENEILKKVHLFRKWFDLKSPAASFLFPGGSEEKCQELLFKYLIQDETLIFLLKMRNELPRD